MHINRSNFQNNLETICRNSRARGRHFALILFSIDRFKLVNGRFGHKRADAVLNDLAKIAKRTLGTRGKLGRWAGDEFLCVVPNANQQRTAAIAAELRIAIANTAFRVDSAIINITASFGLATFPDDGQDVKTLLVSADEALHHAKQTGRNRIVAAANLKHHAMHMGHELVTALREERVMPAYQPIVDVQSGKIVAEEALARIIGTDGQVVAAEEFMAVASQFQLTHRIYRTVVLSAFHRYLSYVHKQKPITHFVNISGDLLRHPELFKELLGSAKSLYASDQSMIAQNFPLVIEITERELLDSPELTRRMLDPFLELGLQLALDDFGSGYSSFHYLADLPVSYLKIDGRFTQYIAEPRVRAIVRGIQNTATELGLVTLAEHVENAEQVDALREIGVNWAQGHYYGAAMLDQHEADVRRQMSINWSDGFYYQKSNSNC